MRIEIEMMESDKNKDGSRGSLGLHNNLGVCGGRTYTNTKQQAQMGGRQCLVQQNNENKIDQFC